MRIISFVFQVLRGMNWLSPENERANRIFQRKFKKRIGGPEEKCSPSVFLVSRSGNPGHRLVFSCRGGRGLDNIGRTWDPPFMPCEDVYVRTNFRICYRPLGVVVALATLAVLPLVWAQPPAGKKYAVLVGVNRYQHDQLKKLSYAEADVADLADLLRKAGYQVTLLTGSAQDEGLLPTKQNIERRMRQVLDGCREGDTVVLAFSGHGLQFEGKDDCFFCPTDARPFADRADTLVSMGGVYKELERSFAGMKVLLVDACRNERPPGQRRQGVTPDYMPKTPKGVAALFSCDAGEVAFEHEKLKHGVFFYHVLEGLRGKAKDADGEVTFAGLASYVSRRVARDVPALVGGAARQSPNLKADYTTEPVLLTVKGRLAAAKPETLKAPFGTDAARAAQQAWAEHLGVQVETPLDLGNGEKLVLVLIPPGSFTMGSPADEKERGDEEAAHAVTLTKPYYLGKYAVTQAQYRAVTGENPSYFCAAAQGKEGVTYPFKPGGGANAVAGQDTGRFPVENVSWDDTDAFCVELCRKAGKIVRLPSEAEWEYACRAGTATPFHFGDILNGEQANCNGGFPYGTQEKGPYLKKTRAVGSYAANAWGLYDMHGNVLQWCADWYGPYKGLGENDPLRVNKGAEGDRVLRGGSWSLDARICRAANRNRIAPSIRLNRIGFRVTVRLD
jgi:formylglycine-generating enzyme required for sulfatase activity